MPLFKIKKSEKAAVSLLPPWHPNFRNFDRLPDVKVVRTSFFVNCAAIMIVFGVSIYLGLQEYNLHSIRVQISDWQRQIDENKIPSEQAVRRYQEFQSEEKKVTEVAAFIKTDFVRSDFIIALGQSLPANVALNSIEVNENGVILRGIVRGTTSDEAFGQAQTYINQLQADPSLSQKFEAITMPNIDPDSKVGNQMAFEISMKPKGGSNL
jgi:hypothetical protein